MFRGTGATRCGTDSAAFGREVAPEPGEGDQRVERGQRRRAVRQLPPTSPTVLRSNMKFHRKEAVVSTVHIQVLCTSICIHVFLLYVSLSKGHFHLHLRVA